MDKPLLDKTVNIPENNKSGKSSCFIFILFIVSFCSYFI